MRRIYTALMLAMPLVAEAQDISTAEHKVSLTLTARWKCEEKKQVAGPQWRVECTDTQPRRDVQQGHVYLWIVPSDDSASNVMNKNISGWLDRYAGSPGYTTLEGPTEGQIVLANGSFTTITYRVRISGHLRNLVFYSLNDTSNARSHRVLGWVRNVGVDMPIDEALLKSILAGIAKNG